VHCEVRPPLLTDGPEGGAQAREGRRQGSSFLEELLPRHLPLHDIARPTRQANIRDVEIVAAAPKVRLGPPMVEFKPDGSAEVAMSAPGCPTTVTTRVAIAVQNECAPEMLKPAWGPIVPPVDAGGVLQEDVDRSPLYRTRGRELLEQRAHLFPNPSPERFGRVLGQPVAVQAAVLGVGAAFHALTRRK